MGFMVVSITLPVTLNCDIFISFRIKETLMEAKALKQRLESHGIKVFLCEVTPGGDIAKAIMLALEHCALVIIMGSKSYGEETNSSYSTYEELRYVMDRCKPYYLIKMCDDFQTPSARFALRRDISYYEWQPPKVDMVMVPDELVKQIIEALNHTRSTSSVTKASSKQQRQQPWVQKQPAAQQYDDGELPFHPHMTWNPLHGPAFQSKQNVSGVERHGGPTSDFEDSINRLPTRSTRDSTTPTVIFTMDRDAATNLLRGQPPGNFVVRSKDADNKFVLSVVSGNGSTITHHLLTRSSNDIWLIDGVMVSAADTLEMLIDYLRADTAGVIPVRLKYSLQQSS